MSTPWLGLLTAWTVLAACDPGPASRLQGSAVGSPAAHMQRRLDVEALLWGGSVPVHTGWEETPERLASASCGACHRAQLASWTAGMHAQAWTNPLFQASFAHENLAWCRDCHAPLAAQLNGQVPLSDGIGCAVCHVRDGVVLGVRDRHDIPAHTVQGVSGFDSAALCEGCHQFDFPSPVDGAPQGFRMAMQNTLSEWRAAGARDCAGCHGGVHRLAGPYDQAWLAKLVRGARLTELADDVLGLRVELGPRGHHLPTGDLFRSLWLEVASDAAFEHVVASARYGRELGTGLVAPGLISSRAVLRDTSVVADEPALSLTFDRPEVPTLFARLRHFSHDPVINGVSGRDERTAREVWSRAFSLRAAPGKLPEDLTFAHPPDRSSP